MFHNELRYVNMFVYHYNARLLSTDHSHFADWYKKVERKDFKNTHLYIYYTV